MVEYRPVTPGVAGSSPVHSANQINGLQQVCCNPFVFVERRALKRPSNPRVTGICKDKDVQQLTFEAYMNKELVRKRPLAHVRIFFKDMAHLFGLARV